MSALWTNAVKTVGGTFEWEKDFEYLHGGVNAFPTWHLGELIVTLLKL